MKSPLRMREMAYPIRVLDFKIFRLNTLDFLCISTIVMYVQCQCDNASLIHFAGSALSSGSTIKPLVLRLRDR